MSNYLDNNMLLKECLGYDWTFVVITGCFRESHCGDTKKIFFKTHDMPSGFQC